MSTWLGLELGLRPCLGIRVGVEAVARLERRGRQGRRERRLVRVRVRVRARARAWVWVRVRVRVSVRARVRVTVGGGVSGASPRSTPQRRAALAGTRPARSRPMACS